MQLRCRFDLDYQHIVDDQVEPLRAERLTFVHDLDVDLTRDTMPSLEELALVVKDPLLADRFLIPSGADPAVSASLRVIRVKHEPGGPRYGPGANPVPPSQAPRLQ